MLFKSEDVRRYLEKQGEESVTPEKINQFLKQVARAELLTMMPEVACHHASSWILQCGAV